MATQYFPLKSKTPFDIISLLFPADRNLTPGEKSEVDNIAQKERKKRKPKLFFSHLFVLGLLVREALAGPAYHHRTVS